MIVVNLNIISRKGNLCCFISCLSLTWNSFGQNTRLKFHVVKLIVELPIYLIVYRTVYSVFIYTGHFKSTLTMVMHKTQEKQMLSYSKKMWIKWKKFGSRATKKKEINMHSDLTITEKYTVDYKKSWFDSI